ncbi:hypothetical protein B9Z55_023090 [Caenorhabditis nigoni]|uniref:Uncharacterized protein n=1 Tax=Caenorhabditis nigoni TaxID=1611254 RepID=A0A2G5SNS1_9PELO|nr:hypothetical protein B9Z55_023090 [Caenorhabditis nigoni]
MVHFVGWFILSDGLFCRMVYFIGWFFVGWFILSEINMTSWHASLQVCQGEAYTRFDDLISAIFLPMWFIPVDPFGGVRAEY